MRKQVKEIGRISSQRIRRLALIGIVVAVLALGATAAVSLRTSARSGAAAASAPQNNSQTSGTARANNLRMNAQQGTFTNQTAQIRPLTQEEAQKLAEGLKQLVNQSTDGLKSVQHADGSVSIDLEGRFQSVAVAKRDENGNVVQSCVDNRQSAAAFFGIDPELLGVQRSAASSKTASPAEKGELR